MPVGVTRHNSPPGAVRRQACANHDPKVSSPSSPLSVWLALPHPPAGVTDAISASPLLAISPCNPLSRRPHPQDGGQLRHPHVSQPSQVSERTHILCGNGPLLAATTQSSVQ